MRDNILYGNPLYNGNNGHDLKKIIDDAGLGVLLERFDKGLDTEIKNGGDGLSLGQKQLIAFMRTISEGCAPGDTR